MPDMNLDGLVVFVTGGAQGIGLDSARRCFSYGARVALVDIDETLAKEEAERLGAGAIGIRADVTDRAALNAAVEQTIATFGRIDVVVANAGVAPPVETVRTGSAENFDRVLEINMGGIVNTVRATLPALLETDGYVLIVSSLYAVLNGVLSTPYAMSKAAAEAFGRSLRVELAGTGVDVGIAYFGFVDTKLVRDAFVKPGINELLESFPRFVTKPVPVDRAGRAVLKGVAKRAPRVVAPGWIKPVIPLRGFLMRLDNQMTRDPNVRKAVQAAERDRAQ